MNFHQSCPIEKSRFATAVAYVYYQVQFGVMFRIYSDFIGNISLIFHNAAVFLFFFAKIHLFSVSVKRRRANNLIICKSVRYKTLKNKRGYIRSI
jgi:hypothetical protein